MKSGRCGPRTLISRQKSDPMSLNGKWSGILTNFNMLHWNRYFRVSPTIRIPADFRAEVRSAGPAGSAIPRKMDMTVSSASYSVKERKGHVKSYQTVLEDIYDVIFTIFPVPSSAPHISDFAKTFFIFSCLSMLHRAASLHIWL